MPSPQGDPATGQIRSPEMRPGPDLATAKAPDACRRPLRNNVCRSSGRGRGDRYHRTKSRARPARARRSTYFKEFRMFDLRVEPDFQAKLDWMMEFVKRE